MTWSEGKRIDVVTTWLITGNLAATAAVCQVPLVTIKLWRKQPWWNDLVVDIQTESDQELDAKLAKRIEKSLEIVNDRLEHGDFQYDPKTGQFVRKPVSVKDGWKVASEMIDKRWLIRKMPQNQVDQAAVGDILKNLANEFADMARKRVRYASPENPQQNETPDQEKQEVLDNDSATEVASNGTEPVKTKSELS